MGPLVAERLATFEARAAGLRSETRSKAERLAALQDLDPATRLLDIKVCDPAMGSGEPGRLVNPKRQRSAGKWELERPDVKGIVRQGCTPVEIEPAIAKAVDVLSEVGA